MLPLRLDEAPLEALDADALAEVLIYLIGREIIRVPARLDALFDLEWGAHVCHFYRSGEELLEFLVPYFTLGLDNGEYCVWVAAPPLSAETSRDALARAMPGFEANERGIEFVDYEDWYLDGTGGAKTTDAVLSNWLTKTQQALDRGYRGLRCSGDTCRVERRQWNGSVSYECRMSSGIDGQRIKAVGAYPLSAGPRQVSGALHGHQETLVKHDQWWHRIAAADVNEARAVLAALQGASP